MTRLLPYAIALAAWPLAALAQYKVVNPDGSVSYTDRPPIASDVKITPMKRGVLPAKAAETELPFELRQTAARYPVTLYTAADCTPCDSGRQLLVTRGVPYVERTVSTEEDAQALDRLAGGRMVPALTIGAQALRGFSQQDWASYLDAAGYPRESRLPRGWKAPDPAPLVERVERVSPRVRPLEPPAPPAPPAPVPEEAPPSVDQKIRF